MKTKVFTKEEFSMNETESIENWFSRAKAEADKGIPYSERVVGVALVVFSVFMMLYFGAHQIGSTGFFTAKFGNLFFRDFAPGLTL